MFWFKSKKRTYKIISVIIDNQLTEATRYYSVMDTTDHVIVKDDILEYKEALTILQDLEK